MYSLYHPIEKLTSYVNHHQELSRWFMPDRFSFYNCIWRHGFGYYLTLLDHSCCVLQLDGLTGVPTRTTATLTPTTLRSIEQTFIDLQSQVEPHHNQAGFVPPVVQPVSHRK